MAKQQFPTPFKELKKKFEALQRKLPMKVSAVAQKEFKENFTRQGYEDKSGVTKWKKRKQPEGKGREGRALLIKTGRLRRSPRKQPDAKTARVVSDVPYAKAQNEGSNENVSVKKHSRRKFKHEHEGTGVFSVKTRRERMRSVKRANGSGEVKSHRRKMNLVARPFMITTDALIRKINKAVGNDIDDIFKST